MDPTDPHRLGYRDVDGDAHQSVLIANMDATGGWQATQRLRSWERRHLGLTQGERLLDVGCGLGDAAIALATDLGSTGELVGIDASTAMVNAARQRTGGTRCAVRFSVGDACSLAEADGSFDAVRAERVLQWLAEPELAIASFARVVRSGGRLSLIDTDWSTLQLDVDDPQITTMVRDGFRTELGRPSNVGQRLADLAIAGGFDLTAATTATQTWTDWNPDDVPAPDGCFSMASLADDLVERDQMEASDVPQFVESIHDAARRGRFAMSLTMHAVLAVAL